MQHIPGHRERVWVTLPREMARYSPALPDAVRLQAGQAPGSIT